MRRIVIALSDTHAGHRLGLMPPNLTLYDESPDGKLTQFTPKQTAVQEWLWRSYKQHISEVIEIADGDPVAAIHNGDLMWGRKYCNELVSTREADQFIIATANLEELFRIPTLNVLRLTAGTGSHGYEESTDTIMVSELLKPKIPTADIGICRHGLVSVDGVTIDYAHHGPHPGTRNWLKGNGIRYYLRSLMMDEIVREETPPRVVLRAHYHSYHRETVRVLGAGTEYVSDIVVTPAYCGLSGYGQQATSSTSYVECGMVVIEIVNGKLGEIIPLRQSVDLRHKENL